MQLPINLNKNNEVKNYPSVHVNNIPEEEIEKYEKDKSSALNDTLISVCKKRKLKQKRKSLLDYAL